MRHSPIIALVLASGMLVAAEAPQPTIKVPTGELVEDMACLSDPTQTYALYLPHGYSTERTWPALLIFDPRGRSVHAAERFQAAAERWGWIILSSNDTRSDGPWEPNLKAIQALWPEVHLRYKTDEHRIYAAGLSGGGHVAYLLGQTTGEIAGVIVSGSRLLTENLAGTSFAVFAAAGDRDFNYQEMRKVDAFVAGLGNPHRFEEFSGLHVWMPPELAAEAVAWMELQAMRRALRPPDATAVHELFTHDLAAARALEAAGDVLGAHRRFEMMTRAYDGLTDVAEPAESAARLAAGREFKRALKEERKWLAFEITTRERFAEAYAWMQHEDDTPTAAELRIALGLRSLEKHAEAPGIEGTTARRLLSTLYSETSYYVGPPLLQAGRWQAAVAVLTVATEIHDGWGSVWPSWYNLACAYARSGDRRHALSALERAVAEGYSNAEHLRNDPDLASLHGLEAFEAIATSLEGSSAAAP